MQARIVHQPFDASGNSNRFGDELLAQLQSGRFKRGHLLSAYVSTGGTGPLGGALTNFASRGPLRVTVGLGNGVTSRQACEHLLQAGARVSGVATGAVFIFHPKIYMLESSSEAWIAIGSCNLTGEGLFRNFETMTVLELDLSSSTDARLHASLTNWIQFLAGQGGNYLPITSNRIARLTQAGLLIDEGTAARSAQRAAILRSAATSKGAVPRISVPPPPGWSPGFARPRRQRPAGQPAPVSSGTGIPTTVMRGPLVWEKPKLPDADALRPGSSGTNPVGGIRLTQAKFRVHGQVIDQTTYFRSLFGHFPWQPKAGSATPQEETHVPFLVTILGASFGTHTLRLSHKPSGEAGQNNYTTILHWGAQLSPVLRTTVDVRGKAARIYAPPTGQPGPYILEIA